MEGLVKKAKKGKRRAEGPALLQCEAKPNSCGMWVTHTFSEARQVSEDGTQGVFYRCSQCGTERMWGTIQAHRPYRKKPKPEDQPAA